MTAEDHRPVHIVIIGAGPGGYPAAFDAADRGMRVTLVNDQVAPGGVCLHQGCIPSKALLHIANLVNEARDAGDWGISFGEPVIDLGKLRENQSNIIARLSQGVADLCDRRGVEYIAARGVFLDSQTLQLNHADGSVQTLPFEQAIIATGSSPAMPSMFDVDDPRVMDSTTALQLDDIPQRLLVVGGGYIGLELGSVYQALGSRVTVVEMTAGLLPGADRDLIGPLKRTLESRFEAILLKTSATRLTARPEGIVVELEGEGVEPRQTFDRVLVAVGRRPNTGNMGLENTQIQTDERGFVQVDSQQRTAEKHILAIGDITGEPMLAHKATHEAKVAVATLAGDSRMFENPAIPAVVFTNPELAWCGLTETQAKADGRQVKISRFPWAASGRAQTLARAQGVTKLIVDPETETILGLGIVGPFAGELIAEGALAIQKKVTVGELAETIHAHPTLSETLMEAAEGYFGRATHIYRPKR